MTTNTPSERDSDRHLRPGAYLGLASLAGVIGLSASYVTIRMFALAIQATEPEGSARELLTLAATLFVVAELTACFLAGLLPVRRLRALRWQLSACALALVAFEAVSIFGARVAMVKAADAHADAGAGRAAQLRASIEANRRSAQALLAAGQHSSQSVLAASRADGARSIRDAAALEARNADLVAELARLEAERKPTARAVFGEAGVIALAVAQSLLMSGIGLLFLGAAGALARAARDATSTATPMHPGTAAPTDAPTTVAAAAGAVPMHPTTPAAAPSMTDTAPAPDALPDASPAWRPSPAAAHQSQALPRGAIAAVLPSWGRYALPASALAAGAGLLVPYAAQAGTVQAQHETPLAATDAVPAQPEPVEPGDRCEENRIATPTDAVTTMQHDSDAPAATPSTAPTDTAPATATPAEPATAVPHSASTPDTSSRDDDERFLRVKEGIEAKRIKPSIRGIYAAEGASQQVARRYLVELERLGIIEPAGHGKGYRLSAA